jgi:hypothetical protein
MLPSRKRVDSGKLPRFIKSVMDMTSDLKNVCLTFLVDVDDVETEFYLHITKDIKCDYEVIPNKILDRPHLGKFYNVLYNQTKFNNPETLVSMVGDDMVFMTKGWDKILLDRVNEEKGIGIFHCRDGIQDGRIAVNLFTSREWVDALGGVFMSELFPADFIDEIHTRVAQRVGKLFYLKEIFLKHEHSGLSDPSTYDDTFKRLRVQYDEALKHVDKIGDLINYHTECLNRSGLLH